MHIWNAQNGVIVSNIVKMAKMHWSINNFVTLISFYIPFKLNILSVTFYKIDEGLRVKEFEYFLLKWLLVCADSRANAFYRHTSSVFICNK